jgi:hypothetical protein
MLDNNQHFLAKGSLKKEKRKKKRKEKSVKSLRGLF